VRAPRPALTFATDTNKRYILCDHSSTNMMPPSSVVASAL